jgi:predicted NUDIX family phosphoesterase
MPGKMDELVLCFPGEILDEIGRFQGVCAEPERFFPRVVMPPACEHVPRRVAEDDPCRKQVIPYVLFVCGDTIFSYRRGKKGSEARLREKHSVGIGGHIQPDDDSLFAADKERRGYYDAMWREVHEEVEVDPPLDETNPETAPCVGLINDDSTPVGSVHFGIVHLVSLTAPSVKKKEQHIITGAEFIPIDEAKANADQYETWSQFCLERLDELRAAAGSA